MLTRVRAYIGNNLIAFIALFFAQGGGAAYASHLVKADDLGTFKVRTESQEIPDGSGETILADCNEGERLISSGAFWDGNNSTGGVRLAS